MLFGFVVVVVVFCSKTTPLFVLFIGGIKIIYMNSTARRGQVLPGVFERAITT